MILLRLQTIKTDPQPGHRFSDLPLLSAARKVTAIMRRMVQAQDKEPGNPRLHTMSFAPRDEWGLDFSLSGHRVEWGRGCHQGKEMQAHSLNNFNWSRVDLQGCVSLMCTAK